HGWLMKKPCWAPTVQCCADAPKEATMSDFNLVSLYFIAQASLGIWFWPLVVVMILLVLGVLSGWRALRRARRSAKRPLTASLLIWLVATIAVTLALPW